MNTRPPDNISWNCCSKSLPPLNTLVWTKIDDGAGVRNERLLKLIDLIDGSFRWFDNTEQRSPATADCVPTHWAPMEPERVVSMGNTTVDAWKDLQGRFEFLKQEMESLRKTSQVCRERMEITELALRGLRARYARIQVQRSEYLVEMMELEKSLQKDNQESL